MTHVSNMIFRDESNGVGRFDVKPPPREKGVWLKVQNDMIHVSHMIFRDEHNGAERFDVRPPPHEKGVWSMGQFEICVPCEPRPLPHTLGVVKASRRRGEI